MGLLYSIYLHMVASVIIVTEKLEGAGEMTQRLKHAEVKIPEGQSSVSRTPMVVAYNHLFLQFQ